MTARAVTFAVSDLATGRGLGLALVCPEGRYASVAWRGADWLDRRHAPLTLWKEIELVIGVGVPPGPLESTSAFVVVLLDPGRRRSVMVQYVNAIPMELSRSDSAAIDLDALLRSFDQGSTATS